MDSKSKVGLTEYFGASNVIEGNKSIKIKGESGRLPADVIPCLQYRFYNRFFSRTDQDFIEGIKFYTRRENRAVVNYPKLHYQNGVTKNQRTNEYYKPTIRILKNARTYMRNRDTISDDLAPSYYLECFLYNVPDAKFSSNRRNTYADVLNWLYEADLSTFLCQNGQIPLFGSSPEQWDVGKAQDLLKAYVKLWNEW